MSPIAAFSRCPLSPLREQPTFDPAWLGLVDIYLEQGRDQEVQQTLDQLEAGPQGQATAVILRARCHAVKREFGQARHLLAAAIARRPQALWPRLVLSQVLVQEGRDPEATQKALRDVLALDPCQDQARRQLARLIQKHDSMKV